MQTYKELTDQAHAISLVAIMAERTRAELGKKTLA